MATRKKAHATHVASGPRVLSARDLRITCTLTPITLPELGGVVYKRELPASVMIGRPAVANADDPVEQQNTVSYFIVKSIVDADGNQIFPDSDADTLRDTLSISTYTILAQAVTGTRTISLDEKGEPVPNASPATRSSDSPTS